MIALSDGRVIELVAVGCWIVWYLVMVGVNLHRDVIDSEQAWKAVLVALLVAFLSAVGFWRLLV